MSFSYTIIIMRIYIVCEREGVKKIWHIKLAGNRWGCIKSLTRALGTHLYSKNVFMTIVFPFYFRTGFIYASTYRTIKIYLYMCVYVYVYYIFSRIIVSIGLYAHVTVIYTHQLYTESGGVKQIEVLAYT